MANDVNYSTHTVSTGGDNTENTLLKIATSKQIDVEILKKLNPNYKYSETLPAGTKVLTGVGSMTDSIDGFAVATLETILVSGNYVNAKYQVKIIDSKGTTFKDIGTDAWGNPEISLDVIVKNKLYKNVDVGTLMSLNPGKTQMQYIRPGTIILLEVCVPGTDVMVGVEKWGIQPDKTRTCYIRWRWDHEVNSTEGYEVQWSWQSSDGQWWSNNISKSTDIEIKEATYSPDERAIAVRVRVRPVAKSGTALAASIKYEWCTYQTIDFTDNWQVITPPAPTVEIKNYKLTATYESLSVETNSITHVQFEVICDNDPNSYNTDSHIRYAVGVGGYVQYSCNIDAGHKYRVRARCCKVISSSSSNNNSGDGNVNSNIGFSNAVNSVAEESIVYYSSWSPFSSFKSSLPIKPELYECDVLSNSVVQFNWKKVNSAESYILQYVVKDPDEYKYYDTPEEYFTSTTSGIQTVTIEAANATESGNIISHKVSNVEFGDYLVRVKAVNEENIESEYSNIVEVVLGKASGAPTTWSSTTTVAVGEPLKLYWIHNPKDNSNETVAELQLQIDDKTNGETKTVYVWRPTDEDKKDETSYYEIDTSSYGSGCKIDWQVRTAGILMKDDGNADDAESYEYGEWSIKRTVDIYAPPTLRVNLLKHDNTALGNNLTTLPFKIKLEAGNATNQKPTGYYISVIAQSDYITVDEVGNDKAVTTGSKVFSKYYDTSETTLTVELSAKDLTLKNNESYAVTCSASMSSGLTTETTTAPFTVAWMVRGYTPNAEVGIDKETLTARIRPFSVGAGTSVNLFVFRREFDGTFTELVTNLNDPDSGLENTKSTWITDPHPALDYARYRIVSRDKSTGIINYYDVPGYPVNEKSVVIQWDEKWQSFDAVDGDSMAANTDKSYTGSMVKIPYNIDVSNSHSPDVSLVRYIGRKRPVSYYGTQLGETATWNMVIPKSDKETLYALRRLAIYMGNVYVREPSGSGYWASISISFSQRHLDVTIPVTINITPVEGGI